MTQPLLIIWIVAVAEADTTGVDVLHIIAVEDVAVVGALEDTKVTLIFTDRLLLLLCSTLHLDKALVLALRIKVGLQKCNLRL